MSAPAGWMSDPFRRFEFRYWDGARWTGWVTTQGQTYLDQFEASTSTDAVALDQHSEGETDPDRRRARKLALKWFAVLGGLTAIGYFVFFWLTRQAGLYDQTGLVATQQHFWDNVFGSVLGWARHQEKVNMAKGVFAGILLIQLAYTYPCIAVARLLKEKGRWFVSALVEPLTWLVLWFLAVWWGGTHPATAHDITPAFFLIITLFPAAIGPLSFGLIFLRIRRNEPLTLRRPPRW